MATPSTARSRPTQRRPASPAPVRQRSFRRIRNSPAETRAKQIIKKSRNRNPCGLSWLKTESPPERTVRRKLVRIADLFCGCGGFSLGAIEGCAQEGIAVDIALAVDKDRAALEVYKSNFPQASQRTRRKAIEDMFSGRLSARPTRREKRLARVVGGLDLLIAGPPCQGHSDLNNHSRRRDTRNSLYARVARAATVLKPQVVVIENVNGVKQDRGRVLSRVTGHLTAHGYSVEVLCLNASEFGVPQNRRRHFLIAFKSKRARSWCAMPGFRGNRWTVRQVIADLHDEPDWNLSTFCTPSTCGAQNERRITYLFKNRQYELPDDQRPNCHRRGEHSYKAVYGRLRSNGIANTVTSGFGSMGQGRYVHPTRRRLITPHEAARIQGIPDWFSFESVQGRQALQQMIGNAVVPRVAAMVIQHLLRCGVLKPRKTRSRIRGISAGDRAR